MLMKISRFLPSHELICTARLTGGRASKSHKRGSARCLANVNGKLAAAMSQVDWFHTSSKGARELLELRLIVKPWSLAHVLC